MLLSKDFLCILLTVRICNNRSSLLQKIRIGITPCKTSYEKGEQMDTKIESSRTKDIVDVIISGIRKGTFAPGERLPSQREMANLFGVSRTVIREAVKILEGRQIVKSLQGSGIYVCDLPNLSPDQEVERSTNTVVFNATDLLQVAWMFWHEAIRLMARNATDEEITILSDMVSSMNNNLSKSTIKERYIYETTFGRITTKYSHNPLMHKMMDTLFDATSDIDGKVVEKLEEYKKIVEIDLKIAEALRERDGARACHLQFERDRVIKQIIATDKDLLNSTYKMNLSINSLSE